MIYRFESKDIKVFPSIHRDEKIDKEANLQTEDNINIGIATNLVDSRNCSLIDDKLVNKYTLTNDTINIGGRDSSGINSSREATSSSFADYLTNNFIVDDLTVLHNVIDNNIYIIYEEDENTYNLTLSTDDLGTILRKDMLPGIEYIKELYIPKSIVEIEKGALSGASSLETLIIPFIGKEDNQSTNSESTVFGYIFGEDSYENAREVSQQYDKNKWVEYYIPKSLVNVIIGGTTLYYGCFSGCYDLVNVSFENASQITDIPIYSFLSCLGLQSISLPGNLTTIKESAFRNCPSLTNLIIPSKVVSIEVGAFYPSAITSVTINSKAIYQALTSRNYSCGQLISNATNIYILSSIDDESNQYLIDGYIKDTILIDNISYSNYIMVNDASAYPYLTFTPHIDGTTTDVSAANTSISGSIEIPKYVRINDRKYLVTTMSGFTNCASITSINIPSSILSIANNTFNGCNLLETVTIDSATIYNSATSQESVGYLINYVADVNVLASVVDDSGNTNAYLNGADFTKSAQTVTIDGKDYYTYTYNPILAYDYNISNHTAAVRATSSDRIVGEITVPSSVIHEGENYSVTSVATEGFMNCSDLTIINLPNTITSLSNKAFEDCSSLTSITIPDTVTSIGVRAFFRCNDLATITFGQNSQLTNIGEFAFYLCRSLTSIAVPSGVTSISNSAFAYCYALSSVTLLGNVIVIGGSAFNSCAITSISLPSSLLTIEQNAFQGSHLTSITIPNSVTSIGSATFNVCNDLQSITLPFIGETASTNKFFGYIFGASSSSVNNNFVPSSLTTVTITSGTEIPNNAFYDCEHITTINLPNTITSIGSLVFQNCSALTHIIIPSAVLSIGIQAFQGCSTLNTVVFEQGSQLTSLGNYVFYNCNALVDMTIPSTVTDIGYSAFRNCSELLTLTISGNVTTIKEHTFDGCTKLSTIVGLSSNLLSIEEYAFKDCANLQTSFQLSHIETLGAGAFYYCKSIPSISLTNNNILTTINHDTFCGCRNLTSITIPNSVTSIGNFAFDRCSLTSITIPNSIDTVGTNVFSNNKELVQVNFEPNSSLTYISSGMFSNCSRLSSITLPNSITRIDYDAFDYCSSLTDITIPNSVTSIGNYAFEYCKNLTSITLPASITNIGTGVFGSYVSIATVIINSSYVYNNAVDISACGYLLNHASTIKVLASIDDSSNNYLSGPSTVFTRTTETIGGNLYNVYTYPNINKLEFTYDTTNKTASVYAATTHTNLISGDIIIPSTIQYQGDAYSIISCGYFYDTYIHSIEIPDTISGGIDSWTFMGCNNLTSIIVDINNAYYSSQDGVLYDKDKTTLIKYPTAKTDTTFNIPNTVTFIESSAFNDCLLSDITIPSSVTTISDSVFRDSDLLQTVTFAENSQLATIGLLAFYNCTSLTSITIPSSVTSIGGSAFESCGLTSITIPSNVGTIGNGAFSYCGNLTSIIVDENNINYTSENDVLYTYDKTAILCYPGGKSDVSFIIPNTVTYIRNEAFYYCQKLESITLPEGLTIIGSNAFYRCNRFTNITIPSTVTSIGSGAFEKNGSQLVSTITVVKAVTPPTLYIHAFDGTSGPIYVPSQSVSAYQNAANWSTYSSRIQADPNN